jgi:hypothetical protein
MKIAYLIPSVISPTNQPLTYNTVRSVFSEDERLRQTVMTVACIDKICSADSTIFLIDNSANWKDYQQFFSYQKNLSFISILKFFPNIHTIINCHPNKSLGESLLLTNFLTEFKEELKQYDVFVKLVGRYFLDSSFNTEILNKSNIFFKKPYAFEWQDWWGYEMVRINENILKQYNSALFAWGANNYDYMLNLFEKISLLLHNPQMHHYDLETLLYFFTREIDWNIIETDWIVYGWNAPTGKFVRD